MAKTHQEMYPEQYTHELVGKVVETSLGIRFKVTRVVTSRFGQLAIGPVDIEAYRVAELTEVKGGSQ